MSTWFTESAWPPIMILATGAVAGVAMFFTTQRVKYLLAVLPLIIFGPMIYAYERRTITERERVEAAVIGVVRAFEHEDRAGTLAFFSARHHELRRMANDTMDLVQPAGAFSVTDMSVTMLSRDSRALSRFRVTGPIKVLEFGDVGTRPSRWELTWQKEGGDWKIIDLQRLDPVSGERMDIDTPAERAQQ